MKEDRLEKFMVNNKEGFDDLEVPPMLWPAIEKELQPAVPVRNFRVLSYAWKVAAAVLIFATAWYLNDYFDAKPERVAAKQQVIPDNNPVLNELSDAEAYYTSQINSRQAELVKYTREHPEILEDLKKEFKELDQNNSELKLDLAESNADEKVIEAIIQSYRIKLEILENVLLELKDAKGTPEPSSINL
ncbi:MAG: hypothetical protein IPH84_19560 [Bacteroidales bacterium]|nr:hypothetical protein [Bacteroidales bacterium]